MESLTVDVTPSQLNQWLMCYGNMKNYADNEKSSLIDVIKSRDGTEVRICLCKANKRKRGK